MYESNINQWIKLGRPYFPSGDFFSFFLKGGEPNSKVNATKENLLEAYRDALALYKVVQKFVDLPIEESGVNVVSSRQCLYIAFHEDYGAGHNCCYGGQPCVKKCMDELSHNNNNALHCMVNPGATIGLLGGKDGYKNLPVLCPKNSRYLNSVYKMQGKHIAQKETTHWANNLMECAVWAWVVYQVTESECIDGYEGRHAEAKAFCFEEANREKVKVVLRALGDEWVKMITRFGWIEEDLKP